MAKILRVSNLSYRYPDGTVGLLNVNLEVEKGETIVIVGDNGTGKTTLFLNLIGILDGDGSIEVFDLPMGKSNKKKIRRKLAILFQNPEDQLVCSTVLDEVTFGPLNSKMDRYQALSLSKKVLSFMEMDDHLTRSPQLLSFGQKKRVAIASVITMDTEMYLLDDPTNGLPPVMVSKVIDLFSSLKSQGKTLIIATHDILLFRKIADRVFIFSKEKSLIATGKNDDILHNNGLITENNIIIHNQDQRDNTVCK